MAICTPCCVTHSFVGRRPKVPPQSCSSGSLHCGADREPSCAAQGSRTVTAHAKGSLGSDAKSPALDEDVRPWSYADFRLPSGTSTNGCSEPHLIAFGELRRGGCSVCHSTFGSYGLPERWRSRSPARTQPRHYGWRASSGNRGLREMKTAHPMRIVTPRKVR